MEEILNKQNVLAAVPQITQQDFLSHIAEALGTYKWPEGSIECIDATKTRLVYLWGNRFKGNAEGTWTAKVNGNHDLTVNNQKKDIPDGTPYSGPLPLTDFDILVINDNQSTPYWAKEFCKIGFVSENFQPISAATADGATVEGDSSGNPLASWMKHGNAIADNHLLPIAKQLSENTALAYAALNILPLEVIQQSASLFNQMGFNSRDVNVQTRNSVTEDPTPVLIPFFVLEFQFEGKSYHIAMMADKVGTLKGQLPPVRDIVKTPEQVVNEEMPDKIKLVKLMKWGWILAIVLFALTNFSVALVALLAWAVGYWLIKKPIKDRIEELSQQAVADTQRNAALLKKQLAK